MLLGPWVLLSSRPPRLWPPASAAWTERSEAAFVFCSVWVFLWTRAGVFLWQFFSPCLHFWPSPCRWKSSSTTISACGLDHKQQGTHGVQTRPRRWAKSTNTHSAENPAYTRTVPHRPSPSFFAGTRLEFHAWPTEANVPHPCTSRPALPPPPIFLDGRGAPTKSTHSSPFGLAKSQRRKNWVTTAKP